MNGKTQSGIGKSTGFNHKIEPLRSAGKLRLGIDIGSTSSDIVVLDAENKIIFSNYQRTKGQPLETLLRQLAQRQAVINPNNIVGAAATVINTSAAEPANPCMRPTKSARSGMNDV